MPSPVTIFGVTGGPPKNPGRLVLEVVVGSDGIPSGGGGGLTPNAIKGVSIAFGSKWNADAPLWQCLDDLGPT